MPDDMKDLSHVLDLALKLPPEARAALASTLLDSLDAVLDADAEAAWSLEVARRARELDTGAVQTVPWSEVRRRLSGE
ncbi:MAG TPA: addiction module protein [Planctomycetota bacterium]|nr:addiction module protein [Planctomycetota bacterium]